MSVPAADRSAARVIEDDAALSDGFAVATGIEPTLLRDAAGTAVLDVPGKAWLPGARYLREVLGLDFLDWLSAVDEPAGDPPGVDVVLHVAGTASAGPIGAGAARAANGSRRVARLMMRTRVPDAAPELPSLTGLWPGVAWHERETFEMFGVVFSGFSDRTGLTGGSGSTATGLRPLLLPDGFEGTPLRKSFQLAARAARSWPGAKEPGEQADGKAPSRRKLLPPGVPPTTWGPRTAAEPGELPGHPPHELPAEPPADLPADLPDPAAPSGELP